MVIPLLTDYIEFITTNFSYAEGVLLEVNLRKKKWVISYSYNVHNQTVFLHMESMGTAVGSLSSKCENIDNRRHVRVSDTSVKDFCDIYSFKHLIR